ncbi:MAG: hypothetical protein ACHQKZ_03625 [Solirubrobacterales bacterium]
MRKTLLLLCLAAAATTPVFPLEEPKAAATASKAEVSVGEAFTVEVRATGPAGTTFTFPPEVVQDTFELRSAPAGVSPLPAGVHRYVAGVFALGDAQVPAIPVRYRLGDGTESEVSTAPVALKVTSLLPRDKGEQKLADIRGPMGVPIGRAFWIGVGVLIILLTGLAWWLWLRRNRKAPVAAAVVPALAPDEEALSALDALLASGRLARGEYRPFYIELTAVAKRYLERRTGAPVVEMTSAEMLAHLRSSPHAGLLAAPMRDLAGAADQIKFARGAGLHDEAERHLAAVRALIQALEAQIRPAVPEGGKAA